MSDMDFFRCSGAAVGSRTHDPKPSSRDTAVEGKGLTPQRLPPLGKLAQAVIESAIIKSSRRIQFVALLRDFKIKGLIGETVDLTLHPGAVCDRQQRLQDLQRGLLEDEPVCRCGSLRLGERIQAFW